MRADGTPLIVGENGEAFSLRPLPLGTPPVDEGRLQAILAKNPHVLPVEEIEPALTPFHFVAREVAAPGHGSIDLLFVSEAGHLIIVETKLWKNPQSRREVVGQIIDYAAAVAEWTFGDLDNAVKKAQTADGSPRRDGIISAVRDAIEDFDDAAFVQHVEAGLKRGRFLLLIVGDAIREDAERLTTYLERTPGLHFTLGLVELRLFRMGQGEEWPLLIHPRTVVRTVEKVRAIVELKTPDQIAVTAVEQDEGQKKKSSKPLSEEAFYDELEASTSEPTAQQVLDLIQELEGLGLVQSFAKSGVSLRLPDPGEVPREYTTLFIRVDGQAYLGWLDYPHKKGGYDPGIAEDYLDRVVELTGAEKTDETATKPFPVGKILAHRDDFLAAVDVFVRSLQAQAEQ